MHGTAANVPGESEITTHVAPIGRLSENIPDAVGLGFHFCFGTFGGWPAFAPDDLGRTVELINASVAGTNRRVDRVHIPALDTLNVCGPCQCGRRRRDGKNRCNAHVTPPNP